MAKFFNDVGKSLRNPELTETVNMVEMNQQQHLVLEEMQKKRLMEYGRLNNDIYSIFSRLFFYINYLYQVCQEQQPMYTYYKKNLREMKGGYLLLLKQTKDDRKELLQMDCQVRQLQDSKSLLEQRNMYQALQVKKLQQSLNNLENDYKVINREEKKAQEILRKQTLELAKCEVERN